MRGAIGGGGKLSGILGIGVELEDGPFDWVDGIGDIVGFFCFGGCRLSNSASTIFLHFDPSPSIAT